MLKNLEALEGCFILVWDISLAVHVRDTVPRDSNQGPVISLVCERLNNCVIV